MNFSDVEAFPDDVVRGSNIVLSSIGLFDNYNYTIKGDSLLLSKTLTGATYTYKLKKQ